MVGGSLEVAAGALGGGVGALLWVGELLEGLAGALEAGGLKELAGALAGALTVELSDALADALGSTM